MSQIVSHSQANTTRSRVLVPFWVVEGVAVFFGTKESWAQPLLQKVTTNHSKYPAKLSSKNYKLYLHLWSEISESYIAQKKLKLSQTQQNIIGENCEPLFVSLDKILKGSVQQIAQTLKDIEEVLMAPYTWVKKEEVTSKSVKASSKTGAKNSQRFNLFQSIDFDFSASPSIKIKPLSSWDSLIGTNREFEGRSVFISLSLPVINSFGTGVKAKASAFYLALEINKSMEGTPNWNSFPLGTENLSAFHKENLKRASNLYDHGILGWDEESFPSIPLEKGPSFFWKASQNLSDAREVEIFVDENISRKKVEKKEVLEILEIEAKVEEIEVNFQPEEKPEEQKVEENFEEVDCAQQKQTEEIQDTLFEMPKNIELEFLMQVATFYESLSTPSQKRSFEQQKSRMTAEEFKKYFLKISQKKKSSIS